MCWWERCVILQDVCAILCVKTYSELMKNTYSVDVEGLCSYSRTKTDGGVELEKATRAHRGLWALMRKLYDILRWRKLLLRALST